MKLMILLSVLNFVSILILFTICMYIYGILSNMESSITNLQEYRKYNEIQLNNLIKDINENDEFLNRRI